MLVRERKFERGNLQKDLSISMEVIKYIHTNPYIKKKICQFYFQDYMKKPKERSETVVRLADLIKPHLVSKPNDVYLNNNECVFILYDQISFNKVIKLLH